ncbi:MAG: hypothetical protein GTN67_03755 [Hydrotalea flava]|uniref:hypothetical protein n=1 Tax=Hydrotalea flava TaxID=714549 RepID=UPI0008310461|nr:hypothetical protein [Hydrotalea flava]RTL52008.1 MAG: hypothetical protein EKK39_07245 [Sphingobacteriales bacterium]NIM34566.1 hypothetical protein [Hydrotalea flava]NIM37406.1 hypothetical protein [Hydrotalea flava]NIN02591.1 hypothetical protein [Hydrotalea flava]NIN14251.1 hypothetical protein [Hydrotalea flava]
MQNILFLNRVALIGNLAFITTVVMRFRGDIFRNEMVSSYFITAGYAVIALNSILFIAFLLKKNRFFFQSVPGWLMIGNFIFYLTELLFFFVTII